MKRRSWSALLAVPALVLATTAGLALNAPAAGASPTLSMFVTLYGWPDNDPPGGAIAYPQIHSTAGGTGTYSNPITFATDSSEFAPGTIVYVPYLKKYFIMEDECAACEDDWSNGKYHIDLWLNGKGGDVDSVYACEDSLTRDSASVVVNPLSNKTVDTTPLFKSSTNTCYGS
jgi:3D (Asp-Asp-Asp) domain-containing protein